MSPKFRLPESWPIVLFGALLALISLVTLVGERGAIHLWRLRGEKQLLDEQNFRLQRENETLRRRIARIRGDDRYLEKLAREELNLVRPGEVIYRFAPSEGRRDRGADPSAASPELPPSRERKSRR